MQDLGPARGHDLGPGLGLGVGLGVARAAESSRLGPCMARAMAGSTTKSRAMTTMKVFKEHCSCCYLNIKQPGFLATKPYSCT